MTQFRKPGSGRSHRAVGIAGLMLALAASAAPVMADTPNLSALAGAKPVADNELADMRGKFAGEVKSLEVVYDDV